jgi:hypothetical protein
MWFCESVYFTDIAQGLIITDLDVLGKTPLNSHLVVALVNFCKREGLQEQKLWNGIKAGKL